MFPRFGNITVCVQGPLPNRAANGTQSPNCLLGCRNRVPRTYKLENHQTQTNNGYVCQVEEGSPYEVQSQSASDEVPKKSDNGYG